MNRRLAIKMMTAPVVVGFMTRFAFGQTKAEATATAAQSLQDIADRISKRVSSLTMNPHLDVTPVEKIMTEEAHAGGLKYSGRYPWKCVRNYLTDADFVKMVNHNKNGRFQIVRAVDDQTFLPKVGIKMYPSETGYENGLFLVVECRTDEDQQTQTAPRV